VLDLSTSPNIDIAGARMLRDLHEELEKDGTTLVLAEVHGYLRDVLWAEELQDRILGIQTRLGIAQLVDQPKSTAVPA
jgi:MFS superfamily sulfate permease-like transporter